MNEKTRHALLNLKIAFLYVGTIIGAGFASGRELMSFFGTGSKWVIPISIAVGIMFFYTAWLFLSLGRLIKPKSLSDITKALFKKGAIVMDIFIVISYFIVMSAMLAGVESLFKEGLKVDIGIPLFSIITLVITMLIVVRGINGIMNASTVLVPIIVVFTFSLAVSGLATGSGEVARTVGSDMGMLTILCNSILYVSMNMLLTAAVLGDAGKNLKKKTVLFGSAVGSTIIFACIFLIMTAIFYTGQTAANADMPMLAIASKFGTLVLVAASVVIWMGVFTTLVSSVYPILEWSDRFVKKRAISVPVIAAVGFGISLLGFSAVVDFLYPVMGAIGLFFIICASVYYFKNRKKTHDISA